MRVYFPRRVRARLLLLSALVSLLYTIAPPLPGQFSAPAGAAPEAQTCNARPPVVVNALANGTATIMAGQSNAATPNTISQIVFSADSQHDGSATNVALDLPGLPVGLRPSAGTPIVVTLSPPVQQYNFAMHALDSGAATTVPIMVTDQCGAWPTHLGAGPGVLPTVSATPTLTPTSNPTSTPQPTSTPTRTPTPAPTSTPPPTATPLPTSVVVAVAAIPSTVKAGDPMSVSWSGISQPHPLDWFALYNPGSADTANLGVKVRTSTCTDAMTGTVGLSAGACTVIVGQTLPTGTYEVRLFRGGGFTRLASTTITVTATIAANSGAGQLFGYRYETQDPGVCGCERGGSRDGYIGVQANLIPPFLSVASAPISVQVGMAMTFYSTPLFRGFMEAGVTRICDTPQYYTCDDHPYTSYENIGGIGETLIWDGVSRDAIYLSPAAAHVFRVFRAANTEWVSQYCGPMNSGTPVCCDLWWHGSWCTSFPTDPPPLLLTYGFPYVFGGQESIGRAAPAGHAYIGNPQFCCNNMAAGWDTWDCFYGIPWRTFDSQVVRWSISGCVPPGAGWAVDSDYYN